MDEPLILLLQRLQTTLVPAILAGGGCVLIITSIVGSFWRREIIPGRRKAVGCFGTVFLFLSIFLYGGALFLHTYASTITVREIIGFLVQTLILFLEGLQNTPVPPILAGAGCIIIIVSIIGIFAGHEISRKRRIWASCFGVVFLLSGIFLYETSLLLPTDVASSNGGKETLKIFFNGESKGATTKLSYNGLVTVTITGEAKTSGVSFSDAFYFYGHSTSHPVHQANYAIWINGKPVDAFLKPLPSYRKDHLYTFKMNASGGHLIFSAGRGLAADKTGYFTINLS